MCGTRIATAATSDQEREHRGAELSQDQIEPLVREFADTLLASRARMIQYLENADRFMDAVARVYELAARYPSAFTAAREGLEIDDGYVLSRFNATVVEVNLAAEAANDALQQLNDEEKARVRSMRLARLAARTPGQ